MSEPHLLAHFQSPIEAHSFEYYGGMIVPSEEELEKVPGYDKRKRIRCSIEGLEPHPCIFHKVNGQFGLMVTKQKMKSKGWIHGQLVDVKIYDETSKYGMAMPEVWEEMMDQEEEIFHRFESLTPGRQRSILHYIGSAKRIETQIQRALLVSRNLKLGAKDPMDLMNKHFGED